MTAKFSGIACVVSSAVAFGLVAIAPDPPVAAQAGADPGAAASAAVMQPRGASTSVDFEVDEVTGTSLDAAGSGDWLAFDLLGHIYRLNARGGEAEVLTHSSGVAINVTPAVSPDGQRIAFSSDRSGQLNLWVMNADGSAPRALTHDSESRDVDPSWSPDGRSIAVVRRSSVPGFGIYFPRTEIHLVALDGSASRVLVKPAQDVGIPAEQFGAPSFSPDGRFLYFHASRMSSCVPLLKSSRYRLKRLELASGEIVDVRQQVRQAAMDCDGERLHTEQETEPRVSPDGRFLAFALTSRSERLTYRGHDFSPGTALIVRDLATGSERRLSPTASALTHALQQWLELNPSSIAWSADSNALFHSVSGRIQRVEAATGQAAAIPFRARVHRMLSERVSPRNAVDVADTFPPALLQWPSTSPDGSSIVFVAAGKLWLARRGEPGEQLSGESAIGHAASLYTPAWSPDGDEIAFSTWDASAAGHVWRYSLRTKSLTQVTRRAGRYVYPVWSADGRSFAYLQNPSPLRMSPQLFESPFDDGEWEVMVGATGTQPRRVATTTRPHRIAFGLDGRLRYVRGDPAASILELHSIDPATLAERAELRIVPAPWYWPEPQLSPDGRWLSVIINNRAFACELSKLQGAPRTLNVSTAAAFDGCRRLDRAGAWFSSWLGVNTVEFTEGTTQIAADVTGGSRTEWPVSVTLRRPAQPDVLLRNATLITMDGRRQPIRGDIHLANRRIACVGKCTVGPATRVLDLTGKFVMPGIVDTHDHTTRVPADTAIPGEWKARTSLAYGVTTRYDPFSRTRSVLPAYDLIETGALIGPRTLGSGDAINATMPEGGPVAYFDYEWPLRTAADAQAEVGWRARLGVPILKHYWSWQRAQGQHVLTAAREAGNVGVTTEALSLHQDLSWILDGQGMWEHGLAGLPIYSDVTRFLGAARVVYTPTLVVESANRFRGDARLLDESSYAAFASAQIVDHYLAAAARSQVQLPDELTGPIQAEAARDIAEHGGRVSIGSHGEIPGLAAHLETWMLAQAMGPYEALRAATVNGAYKLGMSADLGSIEAGKVADLIVLDADPLADIRNTIRIHAVVRNGALYPRETLRSPQVRQE